jgi:hypothetical protein
VSRIRRLGGVLGVAAVALVSVSGCRDRANARSVAEGATPERATQGIDEAVWMALTGDPRFHLEAARKALEEHKLQEAASNLSSAQGLMHLEVTRALGEHVRRRLEGAALEIGEASRQAREGTLSPEELARVTARGLLAMSEHHRELAVAAFKAGKLSAGGVNEAEAARGLGYAYRAAGLEVDSVLARALMTAEVTAERVERDPYEAGSEEADSILVLLAHHAVQLENALGALRH